MSNMITGTVKFFNASKGFGFVSPADGGEDAFVHATALENCGIHSLNEGDKVSYSTAINERSGKTAVDKISMAD